MKVAINGFGRIGRMALRSYLKSGSKDLEIVAINDLADNATLAHLFEFDSTYGRYEGTVSYGDDYIEIDGQKIHATAEKEPAKLPWCELGVDIVLECTGFFCTKVGAGEHLRAGAKRVIISAPAKDEIDATFVLGVNEKDFDKDKHFIISNASCTTNCLAPVAKVLNDNFGIEYGLMNTIHSYTGDQRLLDSPHKDLRRARSAAESIIPTTTGAAKAVSLVIPELKGKLHGFAMRIPSPTASCIDLSFITKKPISVESINKAFENAATGPMKLVLGYESRPLVSFDFRGCIKSSTVDSALTQVMGNKFGKIISWYDNEYAYATRLIDLARYIKENI